MMMTSPVLFCLPSSDGSNDQITVMSSVVPCAPYTAEMWNYYLSFWRSSCKSDTKYFTYLLTPWCRVLLKKLTGLQLVKKFPAFYGTRRFITAFTSFRHPSLSWASQIQSPYPQPTSCRSILILSTHLRLGLPSGLFPSGFPTPVLQKNIDWNFIHKSCYDWLL